MRVGVDEISMVVGALMAGTAGGLTDSAQAAVAEAYAALRDRLVTLLSRRDRDGVVDRFEADPEGGEAELREELTVSGVADDLEVIEAAQRLWTLVNPGGVAAGKYQVDLRDAKGVQVGDRNTQINRF
jgi:hypothetical protein